MIHAKRTKRREMGEGQVAQKMRAMLEELGYEVDVFRFPNGYWRSPRADVMRWEATLRHPALCGGRQFSIGSWDTMSECVRNGFTIKNNMEATMSGGIEVQANRFRAPRKRRGRPAADDDSPEADAYWERRLDEAREW